MSSSYPSSTFLASTHEVSNQPPFLENYNPYLSDLALQEAVAREGGAWGNTELIRWGKHTGLASTLALGYQANHTLPELYTHDAQGYRIDEVRYHPSYHTLMRSAIEEGLHASPWVKPQTGAHVVRAAKYYLQAQVEAGHGCPITMTFAAIPALKHQADLFESYASKIMAYHYDEQNIPADYKKGLTIGMAMTEKQGGTDVRSNSTHAYPIGQSGQAYELVGHKWFVSAPMSDAFLVLAQSTQGLSCFFLPRWRPDGTKNALQIQQLKSKLGNVSNASSETELRGALAWMVGEEGRGIQTIIEMVAMTRYDCMIGSSAGMRQATVQAIHHAQHRKVFKHYLIDQPLMQNLLADLVLESEAALSLTFRTARAMDQLEDEQQALLARILTPIGKYWICKRTPQHAYEAMEVIGGSGVMEPHITSRLFRESPINAIWEGSGNVQCLDILRILNKTPQAIDAYLLELEQSQGLYPALDKSINQLKDYFKNPLNLEEMTFYARHLTDQMAITLQAALLARFSPSPLADAFCNSRLEANYGWNYGTLNSANEVKAIINRGFEQAVSL